MSVDLPTSQVSDDENDLINHLLKQLDARKTRNLLRLAYYDGKHAVRQVGTIIPPEYYRTATVLGWAALSVDTMAQRCNLDGFVWPDGDLEALGAREVWEDNYLGAESNSAIVSSLIHGVAFLLNTAGDVDEPQSLIHVVDALNATGDWNPRTRHLDNLLNVIDRDDNGNPVGFVLYLDGETITAEKDRGKWQVDRNLHPWGVPAEPLVFKPRTGRPFGYSRISRSVMSQHDRALKACIRMEGHADVYSFPQLLLLGADSNVFKNPDGSLKPSWKVALGRVFALPDDETQENPRASVQVVQASSPQPHIDLFKQIAQTFSGETKIPLPDLGVADMANPTSAESLIASREGLISLAEQATDDWSPAFRRAYIRGLAIFNNEKTIPDEWKTIDAKWRSPVYLSRAAQADAGLKLLTAAPELAGTEVGWELLGLSEQQIRRVMSANRQMNTNLLMQRLMAGNGGVAAGTPVPAQPPQPTGGV